MIAWAIKSLENILTARSTWTTEDKAWHGYVGLQGFAAVTKEYLSEQGYRAVRVEVREVEQNAAQEGSQAETDESRRDGAHRSPVASKRPDADVSKGSNPECLIGAENCPPAAAPTHDALANEQVQWMQEFESWLRFVCFQKPTPEAYDLARCAWNAAALRQSGAGNTRALLVEARHWLNNVSDRCGMPDDLLDRIDDALKERT